MLEQLFESIFTSGTAAVQSISIGQFLLCLAVSLAMGALLAFSHSYKNNHSKSFVVTLSLLPAVVCLIIMLVNGNIGAGVAVAGTFSLVRFRSAPGSAREIGSIFIAMAVGLAMGMGYLAYGVLFTLIMGAASLLLTKSPFGAKRPAALERTLRITVPEDLDYTEIFNDLWPAYTSECLLVKVKTTHMGSLFRLTYTLTLKDAQKEKELIDQIRCRNGNLEITCSLQETASGEL